VRDPERLIHGGATDFERLLVSSAANERPSAELGARIQAGLGGVISSRAASAAAWAIPWARLGMFTVVVGGLATLGSFALSRREAPPFDAARATEVVNSPPSASLEMAASPPTSREAPTAPLAATPPFATLAPVNDSPVARHSPAARSARTVKAAVDAAPAGDLREEILLIARVRQNLLDRNVAQALSGLREYGARFPRGAFVPEATVLRIEAMDLDGQHGQAVTLGRQFLGAHPDSPLAERVERVAGVN
jgi:hypothetical protein